MRLLIRRSCCGYSHRGGEIYDLNFKNAENSKDRKSQSNNLMKNAGFHMSLEMVITVKMVEMYRHRVGIFRLMFLSVQ